MAFQYFNGAVKAISHVFGEKRHTYQSKGDPNDVQEPITSAPPEVRELIERVLQAERDKLYMRIPRNINDDILKAIKDVVP